MQVNQMVHKLTHPSGLLTLIWTRFTSSSSVTVYLLTSVLLASTQVPLQITLHRINNNARDLVNQVIEASGSSTTVLVPIISSSAIPTLELCETVNDGASFQGCEVAWDGNAKLAANGTFIAGGDSDSDSDGDGESDDDSDNEDSDSDSDDEDSDDQGVTTRARKHRRMLPRKVSMFTRRALVASPIQDASATASKVIGIRLTDMENDGEMLYRPGLVQSITSQTAFDTLKLSDGRTVTKNELGQDGEPVPLSEATIPRACSASLMYPSWMIHVMENEDFTNLAFHLWLLLLHIIGVLSESLGYVWVSLAGLGMIVSWSAVCLARTLRFKKEYEQFIVGGACLGIDIIPSWFKMRLGLMIPVVAIGVVCLIVLAAVSWKLSRQYSAQTLARLGKQHEVRKMYKLLAAFSAFIQLAAFHVAITMIIWLDELEDGAIVSLSRFATEYRVIAGALIALTTFWMVLGWFAARRENKWLMGGFLLLNGTILGVLLAMYSASAYRFEIRTWPFFAYMTTTTVVLMVVTLALGVWCRVMYDKGLIFAIERAEMRDADYEWRPKPQANEDDKEALEINVISSPTKGNDQNEVKEPTPVDRHSFLELPASRRTTGSERFKRIVTMAWTINPIKDDLPPTPGDKLRHSIAPPPPTR